MIGALFAMLLAPAETGALDAASLRQAMETAAKTHDVSALAGRRFHLIVPFTNPKTSKYPAFKQVAQWRYDSDRKAMVTAIGLGEITDRNFADFKAMKLDALPPLQSLYFDVDADRRPMSFVTRNYNDKLTESGFQTKAVSYGLAIPFKEGGPSAMPEGFLPLSVSLTKGSSGQASRWAAGMIVVFDGQITDAGKNGVFCSDYNGQVGVDEATGQTRVAVQDRQCFVTARIDQVKVVRDGKVLADWRQAPSNPF